ncbi:thioredoxin 1 [Bacilli bacterium PM5-3]|nr:thioredoxin 1 [Bacilli bacterium PM5-3]MDH6603258.1 thioredoxin 1 [Bacilli bacterium PM5-9]
MGLVKLDDNNFETEVKQGITLVDFYADWCGPCKMIAPTIEQLANELSDVKIAKLDVDAAPKTAQKYNVMSIPTLIVFKDGEVVDQKMGFMTKDQVESLINSAK